MLKDYYGNHNNVPYHRNFLDRDQRERLIQNEKHGGQTTVIE